MTSNLTHRPAFRAVLLAVLLGLGACGGPGGEAGIKQNGASAFATVSAPYVPLAECLHQRLEAKEWGYAKVVMPPQMSLLTHRDTAKLWFAVNNVNYGYLVEVVGKGEGASDVGVFAGPIGFMYSAQQAADGILQVAKSCGG